ncbi:EAP30/Vps36 family-domain-containing protein [Scleroderma citrinum]
MALRRYTMVVDGTIPIPALLYSDEAHLATQDNVGIYDGLQKAMNHQSGTVHVTTHRIFFINLRNTAVQSFSMDLLHVIRTDHYTGLLKSSPKVTLFLDTNSVPAVVDENGTDPRSLIWVCEVCNNRNSPGLSPAAAQVCSLCGVPRSAVSVASSQTISRSLTPLPSLSMSSTSLPASSTMTSRSASPPQGNGDPEPIACTACTFHNHPSLRTCEMCSTPLPAVSQITGTNARSAPSSRPVSPMSAGDTIDPANLLIKLSFRRGGDKAFYNILKRSLKARAWEGKQIGKGSRNGLLSNLGAASPDSASTPARRTGIGGIIENVNASVKNTESELSNAFQDLEALMVKARDLVQLAAELNEKLNASSMVADASDSGASPLSFVGTPAFNTSLSPPSGSMFAVTSFVPSAEPEEAKFIRSSLSKLGLQMINGPVTPDMVRDDRQWIEELARELGGILQGTSDGSPGQKSVGIMRQRGIVGLDEVWGGWNRARGVALIPPSTFLQMLQFLPEYTSPPIHSRTFTSGLRVLHTPPYTHVSFTARLSGYLMMSEVLTTSQIGQEENITITLTTEMVEAVEADGVICRDDERSAIKGGGSGSGSELRWSLNIFRNYEWDGHTFV